MQERITMTTDTVAVHGGRYIAATARVLDTQSDPDDGRAEAAYKAAVVMDVIGNLQLAWWTNADATFLGADDGVPQDVLAAWHAEVSEIATREGNTAMQDLAHYIGDDCGGDK